MTHTIPPLSHGVIAPAAAGQGVGAVSSNGNPGIIVVSNRLPVRVDRDSGEGVHDAEPRRARVGAARSRGRPRLGRVARCTGLRSASRARLRDPRE
jgi:hypothetical protein